MFFPTELEHNFEIKSYEVFVKEVTLCLPEHFSVILVLDMKI